MQGSASDECHVDIAGSQWYYDFNQELRDSCDDGYFGCTYYDAYGNLLWKNFALGLANLGYKAQYGYWSELGPYDYGGLYYCHHRWYDSNIGRWISRDPSGMDGGVNTYAYCGGDPVLGVDPSGLATGSYQEWLHGIQRYFQGFGDGVEDSGAGMFNSIVHFFSWKGNAERGQFLAHPETWAARASNASDAFGQGVINWGKQMNSRDPYERGRGVSTFAVAMAGEGFGSIVELLELPQFSFAAELGGFEVRGPFVCKDGSVTLLRVDRDGVQRFRLDVGKIHSNKDVHPLIRGKYLPHYHRRGNGNIKLNRPWEKWRF